MAVDRIYPSSHFVKAFKRLPKEIRLLAEKKEGIFKSNPFDPHLKTHKLKGRLKGYWAYSLGYRYRVIFRFIDNNSVLYLDIGTHGIYEQ